MKRLLILLSLAVLWIAAEAQTTYSFAKNNCRLEISRGATLRHSMLLEDLRWADRSGSNAIEVWDGVTSFTINNENITSHASIALLKTDLTTWRLACLTRVSGDTLFIGNDTLLTGASASPDSLYAVSTSTWLVVGDTIRETVAIGIACSDLTSDLAVNTSQGFFRAPYAFTLTDVRAQVLTAPVGSTIEVDINEGGVSVLSTVISIDASEKTSETAATPPVISDTAIGDDSEITIDIDQIGASTAGAGLVVWLIGTK